jgi:hypothetical protein
MKIRAVGAELSCADRQTRETTKLIVAFRNFANAPKMNVDNLSVENLSRHYVHFCTR